MKELKRSRTDYIILGVCGGIGEYLDTDPLVFRLLFILFTFLGGAGIFLYIALAVIMPAEENFQAGVKESFDRIQDRSRRAMHRVARRITRDNSKDRSSVGLLILLIGLYYLLYNLNLINSISYGVIIPVFVIIAGFIIFYKKTITLNTLILIFAILLLINSLISINIFHIFSS